MKNTTITLVEKFTSSAAAAVLIGLFSLSGFLSCAAANSVVKKVEVKRVDTRPPIDAFAFIIVEKQGVSDRCLPSPNFNNCKKIIKQLPVIKSTSVGSGLLVRAKTKPVVLTAAHVCLNNIPEIYETEGVRISIKSDAQIKIRISSGKIMHASVIKYDLSSDLCALQIAKPYTQPIEWSRSPPIPGDKVYAISAPLGINAPTMNLVFEGRYSGYIGMMHHYTIPARPGSSGSVVLNKNFKGVGMINAAYLDFESIGFGAGFSDIKKFLDSI